MLPARMCTGKKGVQLKLRIKAMVEAEKRAIESETGGGEDGDSNVIETNEAGGNSGPVSGREGEETLGRPGVSAVPELIGEEIVNAAVSKHTSEHPGPLQISKNKDRLNSEEAGNIETPGHPGCGEH